MDPSWIPQEDAATLFNERTWLNGAILTGVGYGAVVTLYCFCFRQLLKSMNESNRLQRIALLVYTTLITLFGTLFMAACARMTELSFIDYRLFPGGPAAFENDEFSIPPDELGNVTFVLANWFADALIVWRCMIIYRNCRYPTILVMVIPCLAYLGSFTMGVMWLVQVSASQSSPWLTSSINFTPPYFWLSLALNITMTLAIVARLLVFKWRISSALGKKYGSQYTGIAALLVESAVLYSAFSLLFLIPFALNHPLANIFIQMLSQVQIISPLMIIYRVASGDAWSSNTTTQMLSRTAGKPESIQLAVSKFQARSGESKDTKDTGATKSSTIMVNISEEAYSSGGGSVV